MGSPKRGGVLKTERQITNNIADAKALYDSQILVLTGKVKKHKKRKDKKNIPKNEGSNIMVLGKL